MAPKLMPDNLLLPDSFLLDLDRNRLDGSIFPLSHHAGELTLTPNSYSKKYTPLLPLPSPYPNARLITDVRPGSQVDFRGSRITYDPAAEGDGTVEFKHYLGGKAESPRVEVEKKLAQTKSTILQVGQSRSDDRFPGADVEVFTMGTGSSIPNKYRNGNLLTASTNIVSSTLLMIPGVGNIILDCGEGTLASLKRQFSPSEYLKFIQNLRAIY